ncbi:hypothetical protein C8R43DRAFT_183807 [Mycena crocata]|nr:hypothetical protein C8R43DRAFT_183807 [Mycena crocata]
MWWRGSSLTAKLLFVGSSESTGMRDFSPPFSYRSAFTGSPCLTVERISESQTLSRRTGAYSVTILCRFHRQKHLMSCQLEMHLTQSDFEE